jgi:hypothetical protein
MAPPNDQYAILGHRLGFRLNYLTPALRAERETWTFFRLNDLPVKVRYQSVTIHDVINDAPNTCTLTVDAATPPTVGQRLVIRINSNAPRTLFAGPLQTVGLTFELQPHQTVYPCQAIDDTPLANRKLPYGQWVNTSATTVAQWLVATFAPGFTAGAVQAALPPVSVNFDTTEGMDGCLRQLAKLIGGYFYWEDRVLHLFTDETTDLPDPIDALHPFLLEPAVAVSTDTSQVRTRVYGKGYAEEVIADVAANDTIIPVSNAVMFNPAGGQAVSETQRLRYTGTDPGGSGSLVGPGIGPAASPALALLDGVGVTPGAHWYTVTFQTAAGESLIGPGNVITVGTRPPPTIRPTIHPLEFIAAGGVDLGDHSYAWTDNTATGETLPGPVGNITVRALTPPPTNIAPIPNGLTASFLGLPYGKWIAGAQVAFYYTYASRDDYGAWANDTALSIASSPITLQQYAGFAAGIYMPPNVIVPQSADPYVTYIHLWGFVVSGPNGADTVLRFAGSAANNYGTGGSAPIIPGYNDNNNNPYPGTGNPNLKKVTLSVPATGDPAVTARNVYRTPAGSPQLKYLQTIGPGAVNIVDTLPDASLGVNVITTPTAAAARVALSGIPLGASTVTARNLYRTVAGGAPPYKRLATLADNTTTIYTDAIADAGLGVNAPAADTSGLKQPDGVVLAGAPTIVVAGAAWARPLGGWAIIGNGQQRIRYTAISGNTLTGIPATGPGAITATVAYNSTITAAALLLGMTGLVRALIQGAPINLWVQRDDPAAQAALTARDGTDGIIEHLITDERRGETSLAQLCDADLQQYAYPIQTVPYATRDVKTKSGKPITIALATPAINLTLTIQDVTITEINLAPRLNPRFTVTASSVRFSLEDILRRLGASLDVTS